jgi:hypothetical protein
MDGVSAAASIVGLIVPAAHAVRLLLDDIHSISKAPEAITSIAQDLESLSKCLTSLGEVPSADLELLSSDIAATIKSALEQCSTTCLKFRTELRLWTKHLDDGKLSWVEKVKIGFFKQKRLDAMSSQLQSWRIMINQLVGVATL